MHKLHSRYTLLAILYIYWQQRKTNSKLVLLQNACIFPVDRPFVTYVYAVKPFKIFLNIACPNESSSHFQLLKAICNYVAISSLPLLYERDSTSYQIKDVRSLSLRFEPEFKLQIEIMVLDNVKLN